MKRKVIATVVVAAAIVAAWKQTRITEAPIAKLAAQMPASEKKTLEAKLAVASPKEALKELRASFLEIQLADPNAPTDLALAKLASGLSSENETARLTAARFVQSLLIDVAYAKVKVSPKYEENLRALFALHKTRGKEEIEKTRLAFPQSPTLNHISKL